MKNLFFVLTLISLFASCKKKEDKSSTPAAVPITPTPTSTILAVTYVGNGNTSGSVPIDTNSYHSGDTAVVLANTGNLAKSGFTFMGWNSDSTGTAASYCPQDRAIVSANLKLYAKWISSSVNPASENTTLNCGGSGWLQPSCAASSSLALKGIYNTTEVTLSFYAIPGSGSYSVSSVPGPSNVHVTVQNAFGQPCGITWYGRTGTVNVTTTANSISANFTGVLCTQIWYNFPVVSLNGSLSCN